MTYNRSALKIGAKEAIRGVEPHPAYITFVYLLLSFIISTLIQVISGYWDYTNFTSDHYFEIMGNPYNTALMEEALSKIKFTPLSTIVVIALALATILLTIGWLSYCLKLSRKEQTSISDLFSGVKLWGKAILVSILIGIFTFLWTLLFFFPGVIAAYRYSQAYFILVEHPNYSPLQCIRESKRIMRGYKWKCFVLNLSFIGWSILITLTFGILGIWKQAYIDVTRTRFYEFVRDINSDGAPADYLPDNDDNDDDDNSWND